MREDRERRPDQRHRRNGARKMEEGGWGKESKQEDVKGVRGAALTNPISKS